MLQIDDKCLWETLRSGQEKVSRCNWNGASGDKHIKNSWLLLGVYFAGCDVTVRGDVFCCSDVQAGWSANLNALLYNDLMPAGDDAMLNEPTDGAAFLSAERRKQLQ